MSETLTTTETASTDLAPEEQIAVGAGAEQPEPPPEPKEPEAPKSRREAIAAAADKLGKEEPEEGGKPREQTPKPAKENPEPVAEDGKSQPEGGEKTTEEGKLEEEKTPEDGKQKQPPAPKRFLTKAKETWANTPNSVKAEVVRLERDYEELSQRATENEQYRESLRTFDEYAQRNGIKLSQALEVFTGLDQLLKQNPVQAVADILKTVGLTPQQYAQIVQANSPEYQAHMMVPRQQAQPQAPQVSPREQQLQQQLQEEQRARVNAEVIAPFAASHPRFHELQETVVQCLNSGMIPTNLAPVERLEAAYDMAERLSPRSVSPAAQTAPAQDAAQTAKPRAGTLQVKGAPSSGNTKSPVARGKLSRKAAIEAAMEQAGA